MRILKGLIFLVLVGIVGAMLLAVVSMLYLNMRPSVPHPTGMIFAPNHAPLVSPLVPWLVVGGVVVVGTFVVLFLAWLFFGGRHRKDEGTARASEEQMLYEIHRGLAGMDKRIEALETILLERAGEKSKQREFDSRLGV